jgi:threonine/homoserine/homoserine lactone efflux protein
LQATLKIERLGFALIILLIKGLLVGLLASIPMGPAGVLCIQRTLNRGRLMGFMSGAGIALADTIFSVVAVLSLSVVQDWIAGKEAVLQVLVGVVVVVVAVRIMLSNPVKQLRSYGKQRGNLLGAMTSLFFLTINPINLLPVLFLVGLFKVSASGVWQAGTVVLGVMVGALAWWFFISTIITHYRKHFKLRQMWWINKVAGGIILTLGAVAFVDGAVKIVIEFFF